MAKESNKGRRKPAPRNNPPSASTQFPGGSLPDDKVAEEGAHSSTFIPKQRRNTPGASRLSLAYWRSLIFKEFKLPGWFLFIWGLFILIPDVKGRFDFWWDASQYLGGRVAMIGAILTHPAFGALLMISGVAYLVFVDEPKRPTVRASWPLYLGWGIILLVFLAVFTVSIISYITEQVGPRHIFPLQAAVIRDVLAGSSTERRKTIGITYVGSCFDCDGYADEFGDLISSIPGWSVVGRGTVLGPRRESISALGVAIADTNPSAQSSASLALQRALTEAKIPFEIVTTSFNLANPQQAEAEIIVSARRRTR